MNHHQTILLAAIGLLAEDSGADTEALNDHLLRRFGGGGLLDKIDALPTPSEDEAMGFLYQLIDIVSILSPSTVAVLLERSRQVNELGYTPEADAAQYQDNELGNTAAGFAYLAGEGDRQARTDLMAWWAPEHIKFGEQSHDLRKAGALVLAQLDLLK